MHGPVVKWLSRYLDTVLSWVRIPSGLRAPFIGREEVCTENWIVAVRFISQFIVLGDVVVENVILTMT